MGRIGLGELVVIALIAVLLFGAGRLSDIGRGIGEGIRNLKKGLRDDDSPPAPSPGPAPMPAVAPAPVAAAVAAAPAPAPIAEAKPPVPPAPASGGEPRS